MPQAGIHGLAGMAVRRIAPRRKWLMFGIVLGNLFPDLDNLAVAAATLTGRQTTGLHRTFSHSLFFVAAIVASFYIVSRTSGVSKWGFFGLGLGLGIGMHIALDLLIWFNGVSLLWPIPLWINLWEGVSPPIWLSKLLMPAEFLFFGIFLSALAAQAQLFETNTQYITRVRFLANGQFILFVIFTILVYLLEVGFMVPYGALYLISLGFVIWIVIQMRDTVDRFA